VGTEIEVVSTGTFTELVVVGNLVVDTTGMDTAGRDSSLFLTALGSRFSEALLED
jgi:hypothetical protein